MYSSVSIGKYFANEQFLESRAPVEKVHNHLHLCSVFGHWSPSPQSSKQDGRTSHTDNANTGAGQALPLASRIWGKTRMLSRDAREGRAPAVSPPGSVLDARSPKTRWRERRNSRPRQQGSSRTLENETHTREPDHCVAHTREDAGGARARATLQAPVAAAGGATTRSGGRATHGTEE